MGNLVASRMDDVMKKNTAVMMEQQRVMLERQIQMNNAIRERQMAMQLARSREMLNWWGAFYGIATLAMIGGFRKTKKPGVLAPILPLTFIVGYQLDLAYLGKMSRIKVEADSILENECGLLAMPGGLPTVDLLDEKRKK